MNPEVEQKLQELEAQIMAIRNSHDIEFIEAFKKYALNDLIDAGVIDAASDANINQSIGSAESFTSPQAFDKRVRVEIGGVPYYLGLFNI